MADPLTTIEFTFGFSSGEVQTITYQEGRDLQHDPVDGDMLYVEVHHEPQVIETLLVSRKNLDYLRTIKRTTELEPRQYQDNAI